MKFQMKASMPHALTAQGIEYCRKHYFKIKRKGSMVEIIFIEGDFYRNRQVVPAIYLGPTRDARYEHMNAFAGSQLDQIILVEKRRPGTDEAHIPLQDAEQLRQFVQAVFSENPTDSCQILIWRCQQVRGHSRCFDFHCPELRHPE